MKGMSTRIIYTKESTKENDILLAETLARLDGNTYGLTYSSGSAVLVNVVALLGTGSEILSSTDVCGGTYRYLVQVAGNQGIKHKIIDLSDLKAVEYILKNNLVKIIWVETPTNPMLKVIDIERLSKLAKKYKSLLVVDNTLSTPVIQRPAEWGADIVVYSTTKYINGHGDASGGALTTSNFELYSKLKFIHKAIGAHLSPSNAWLTLRGIKTLELRMERQSKNAEQIAVFLHNHRKIKEVFYPGLYIREQKKIVKKQMKNAGGMISIVIKDIYDVWKFISHLKYFSFAESLGGVQSLIEHPASMSHSSLPQIEREKIGITDKLLRISVGIENIEDLIGDLKQALYKI